MKMLLLSSENPEKYGGSRPKEYKRMVRALKKGGVDALHVFITTKDNLLKQLEAEKPDLVFSGIDQTQDSDGNQSIAEILDALGIPYVGSNQAGLDTALDKAKAKGLWEASQINTPKYFVLTPHRLDIVPPDAYPLIVKPIDSGGSRGITSESVVRSGKELSRQVKRVVNRFGYKRVLAEKFLGKAREFTISVIGNGGNKLIMPSELVSQNGRKRPLILTHSIKDGEPGTRPVEPEVMEDGPLRRRLCRMAVKMFDVCGLRDYARVDIMMDMRERLHAIEINAQTVFESYFLTGLKRVGMNYASTVNSVIYAAILRHQKTKDNIVAPNAMGKFIPISVREQLSGERQ